MREQQQYNTQATGTAAINSKQTTKQICSSEMKNYKTSNSLKSSRKLKSFCPFKKAKWMKGVVAKEREVWVGVGCGAAHPIQNLTKRKTWK